jgi:GMP synthase-like glutamine amidotransferase
LRNSLASIILKMEKAKKDITILREKYRNIKLSQKKILILDYSLSGFEAPAIKRWLPEDSQVSSLFINTKESFPDDLIENDFTHVIHSGSELSITKTAPFTKKAVTYIQKIRGKDVSQMGICYGHQLLCLALAGKHSVRSSPIGFEAGWCNVTFNNSAMNELGVSETEILWQHHFDEVVKLPEGSELLATNSHTKIQAYVNYEQHLFGTQFHPEFDKQTGNEFYLKDSELLEKNSYNVDAIIKGSPSIDAGKIFFNYFLEARRV